MLRPPERAPLTRPLVGLPGLALLLLAVVATLSGCGSASAKTHQPSQAALSCRAEWKNLGAGVAGRDSLPNPSALAPRWNAVSATVDYYATSGSAGDCGTTVDNQRKAMDALLAFAAKLAPYDMEFRLGQVKGAAAKYAAGPQPPAATPSPAAKGSKRKPKAPLRAPDPRAVGAALQELTKQAPLATQQQGPGWEQARVIEISDAAAVTKAVKDLAFLSSESPAFRACQAALALIARAIS